MAKKIKARGRMFFFSLLEKSTARDEDLFTKLNLVEMQDDVAEAIIECIESDPAEKRKDWEKKLIIRIKDEKGFL